MHRHPQARIDVQGGGSSAGIYAATHRAADLGASSRELIGEEKNWWRFPSHMTALRLSSTLPTP